MDYIFYRVYLFYEKYKEVPFTSGVCQLLMIKAAILFFVLSLFNIITDGYWSVDNEGFNPSTFMATCLVIMLVVFIRDIFYYKKKKPIKDLKRKYRYSKWNNKIKMWYIFLLPYVIIALGVYLSWLTRDWGPIWDCW